MVLLHIKRGEASQFLYETQLNISVEKLIGDIVTIFNGRLKVNRVCAGKIKVWKILEDSYNFFFIILIYRNGGTSELRVSLTTRHDGVDR
jgi:hypothetical protein